MVDTSTIGPWEFTKAKEPADQRFAAFMTCHSRFVFRVAFAVLRNHADAEDSAQETFLKLYRLGGWEQAENQKAFLARAAWRVAITRKRPKWLEPEINVEAKGNSPEQAAIAADQERWVHRLIDALPDQLRLPLALSTVEELTSAEIGLVMDLPEGTVRTRVARARQILRIKIKERYGTR